MVEALWISVGRQGAGRYGSLSSLCHFVIDFKEGEQNEMGFDYADHLFLLDPRTDRTVCICHTSI
jgi:hypothetical protein